jgi:hypothetical protein
MQINAHELSRELPILTLLSHPVGEWNFVVLYPFTE